MKGLYALADQARWVAVAILLVAVVCDLLATAYDRGWDDGWNADDPSSDHETEVRLHPETETTE